MKRLRLQKLQKSSKSSTETESRSIQQLILGDVKNINKFNILIEEFILSLQNNNRKSISNISKILLEIYDFFFIKNKAMISNDLRIFLQEKLNIIISVYIDIVNPEDEDSDPEQIKIVFRDIQKFLKFSEESKVQSLIDSLVDSFILNEDLMDSNLIKIFSEAFISSNVYFSMIFNSLYNKLLKIELTTETLFNVYNFIISIGTLPLVELKLVYQNIIIILVNNCSLPKEILTSLLTNLNKVIFDNLENPLIFSDYLINIYEKSSYEEFEVKVLSLSGLFVLLTKYKLDYNNYYNMLYRTISMKNPDSNGVRTVFDSKNRNRLFKILELSLKSPTVPIIVILSFLKKLARICLVSFANNVAIILGIIQNTIQVHPRAAILLIRNKRTKASTNGSRTLDERVRENSHFDWGTLGKVVEEEITDRKGEDNSSDYSTALPKFEQFDDEELDTYKTKADKSCLWELYTLKSHYSYKIRLLVNKFEKNFLISKGFDLNSVSNITEQDLLYDLNDNPHFYISSSYSLNDLNHII